MPSTPTHRFLHTTRKQPATWLAPLLLLLQLVLQPWLSLHEIEHQTEAPDHDPCTVCALATHGDDTIPAASQPPAAKPADHIRPADNTTTNYRKGPWPTPPARAPPALV